MPAGTQADRKLNEKRGIMNEQRERWAEIRLTERHRKGDGQTRTKLEK